MDDVSQSHASSQPVSKTPVQASKSNREQARALGQALSTWFAQQTRYRSQSELARALGLPFGTLRGYLMGIRVPSAETLLKLHEVTGLPEFAQAAATAPSTPARPARARPTASAQGRTAPVTSASPATQASPGLRPATTPAWPATQGRASVRPPSVQRPAQYPRVPATSPQPPAPRPESIQRPAFPSGRSPMSTPASRPAGAASQTPAPVPGPASMPDQAHQHPGAQNSRNGHSVPPAVRPPDPAPPAPPPAPQAQERPLEPLTPGERACADCGQLIPAERLAILPHATRCVQCQAVFERLRRRALAAQQPARRIDWSMLAEQ